MLVETTHPVTGKTKIVKMNECEYRAAKILSPDTVRVAPNFIVNETPVSELFMGAKLADMTFTGDITDIDAIRKTTAELLIKHYGKDHRDLAGIETVDVWVYDPDFGWDKTAIFSIKDLLKQ